MEIVQPQEKFPVNMGETPGTKGGKAVPMEVSVKPETHGSPASKYGVEEDLGKC